MHYQYTEYKYSPCSSCQTCHHGIKPRLQYYKFVLVDPGGAGTLYRVGAAHNLFPLLILSSSKKSFYSLTSVN